MRKISLFLCILVFSVFTYAQNQLHIYHLDVGQEDSNFIVTPSSKSILIDAGKNGKVNSVVLPFLSSLGVTHLDYVIASHYHADHIGGIDEVLTGLGGICAGVVYDRGTSPLPPANQTNQNYLNATAGHAFMHVPVCPGRVSDLDQGVFLKCVASAGDVLSYGPVSNDGSDENDLSVAFVLAFGRYRNYTGGDCGGSGDYADLETPMAAVVKHVDAFKVNHHSSPYATNQTFVNVLRPSAAVIELGDNNSYHYPAQAVLNRLSAANCMVYQAETGSGGTLPSGQCWIANGDILVETDGNDTFTVSFGQTSHSYSCRGGIRGDLNGDGLINHDDVHLLGEYFAGDQMLWNIPEPASADVNGNGLINLLDLVLVRV